jgi:hypothetical protein
MKPGDLVSIALRLTLALFVGTEFVLEESYLTSVKNLGSIARFLIKLNQINVILELRIPLH